MVGKVLIGCEFSGRVRDAFRARGINAVSCDVEPSEAGEPHLQCDLRDVLNDGWDMLIAFPPCTYLAGSGARHWLYRQDLQEEALEFVQTILDAPINYIALENPIGVINTRIRPPNQIIQPWQHGHGETKATCFWLKNLPPLQPSCIVKGRESNILNMTTKGRSKKRSRTYHGVAYAMAAQWGQIMLELL